MSLFCILAVSSLSGARMGIDGLVLICLFSLGLLGAIIFLSRHEYSPEGDGIFGGVMLAYISALIGGGVWAWVIENSLC